MARSSTPCHSVRNLNTWDGPRDRGARVQFERKRRPKVHAVSRRHHPPGPLDLRRDRPYERLTITGIRGLTEAEVATLRTLGAVEDGLAAPD